LKPLLKWAGGKHKVAVRIAGAFDGPCAGTYYEPFLGGASVYLHLRAQGLIERAVLADANGRLIGMYQALQRDVDGVIAALRSLPEFYGEPWPEAYYAVRDGFNEGGESALQAARLLWLNRACFNGLYRENRKGRFNVPVGRHASVSLHREEHLREVGGALRGVELLHASFEQLVDEAGPADFVYCDPPYVPASASAKFTDYARAGFDLDDQRRLAESARAAAERGAVVVLSNHDVPVVHEELYRASDGFTLVERFGVRRSIGCDAATRGNAKELLVRIDPESVASRPDA